MQILRGFAGVQISLTLGHNAVKRIFYYMYTSTIISVYNSALYNICFISNFSMNNVDYYPESAIVHSVAGICKLYFCELVGRKTLLCCFRIADSDFILFETNPTFAQHSSWTGQS